MYKAHCPRCGNIIEADELAFDFGKLINKELEIDRNRTFGNNDNWFLLTQVNLCLYLSLDDLIRNYNFINDEDGCHGTFIFTTDKLEKHLLKLTRKLNANINTLANTQGIEYENLTRFMALNKGEDKYELADKIQQIAKLIILNPKQEICEFEVEVLFQEDDQHRKFANSLSVTFGDDRITKISSFVCKGNRNIPCGNILYGHLGRYQEVIIGLAGTARVGKTAYLASLVSSIMHKRNDDDQIIGHNQDLLVNIAYTGNEFNTFNEDIIKPYINGQKIKKTEEKGESIPLFSLTFRVNNRKNYIFTFIDMPGEVYDKQDDSEGADFILNSREIIKHASVIWLCITPSQIKGEEVVATSDRVNMKFEEALTNIEKTMKAINVNGKIPTAVLITRSDEANEESGIYKPDFNPFSNQTIGHDIIENKNENTWWISSDGILYYDHMEWFIKKSYDFLNQNHTLPVSLENVFGKFTPFALASYGFSIDNPFGDNDNKTPNPSMIEGPFLWTLGILNIIPVYKQTNHTITVKKLFRTVEETEIINDKVNDINELFYYPFKEE